MSNMTFMHQKLPSTLLASAIVVLLLFAPSLVVAKTQLTVEATKAQQSERVHNQQREQGFKAERAALTQERDKLKNQLRQLQDQVDSLTNEFSNNEQTLATLEEKRRLETGSLGEVFGVVRQSSKDLKRQLHHSITAVDKQNYNQEIEDITQAKTLPSLEQLTNLWKSLEEQILATNEVAETKIPYVSPQGEKQSIDAIRVGDFALITKNGLVDWLPSQQVAVDFPRLPHHVPTIAQAKPLLLGDTVTMTLDPSQGEVIQQLAMTPTLRQRIEQGGVVGYIILSLMLVGLCISAVRLVVLSNIKTKIKRQLKTESIHNDNPLGRILAVNSTERKLGTEALELRLLEAVMDEQSKLETGLSMLKLLAALAPMLGLLGTVSGMIETFQVITQYGNGDPTIMAGGISTALITTVLGLVAAMPLLFTHNLLSSQVETIRIILEKQGIGLVAERAEQNEIPLTMEKAN
jgi:biopolymer transport protein ExbB